MPAQTVHATIARPWREVCDFLGQAPNYARWASWIGPTLEHRRGDWIAHRPGAAPAKVRFTERNAFGVADHCLLESAECARFVALRAVPHGDEGSVCEVLLTFFDEPDAQAARQDLLRLKALIEQA